MAEKLFIIVTIDCCHVQKPRLPVSKRSKRRVEGKMVALPKGSAPELRVSSLVGAMEGSIRQKTVVTLKACNRAVEESQAVGPADSNPCSLSPAEVRHAVFGCN